MLIYKLRTFNKSYKLSNIELIMKEVEIKVKNIDKRKIIAQIEKLGARINFSGRIIDHRYDTIDRDLSKKGKALRIRQKGKYFYLNLKGKKKSKENIIGRDEIGVRVSSFTVMHRILTELGYVKIFQLDKIRTEYKIESDNIKFDIDEYVGLEPMLEIESDNYEKVQKYVNLLEIKESDLGRMYIREIIAAKKLYNTLKEKKKILN
jgi:predicted adenylyl cyclase CyaB